MTKKLTQSEFDAVVSIYGSNVENWPEVRQEEGLLALKSGLIAVSDEIHLDAQIDLAFAVSTPSDILSRRILKAAQVNETPHAANENIAKETRGRTVSKWRFAGIAAMALFAVGFALYPNMSQPSEDDVWLEAAAELGFDDIYEWVQNEDT